MASVGEILSCLENKMPAALAEQWDNCGLLIGGLEEEVTGVLLSLDISSSVVSEAGRNGCNLILCHHPIIFQGIKNVTASNPKSKVVYELLRAGINVLAFHTPLDSVAGGANDLLAKKLGFFETSPLCKNEIYSDAGIGRIGVLNTSLDIEGYVQSVKNTLDTPVIQYRSGGRPVHKVAIVGGSGDDYIEAAIASGCDTLITGDLKYHALTEETGLNLICAGHFYTEVIGLAFLEEILRSSFGNLKILYSKEQYKIISYQ